MVNGDGGPSYWIFVNGAEGRGRSAEGAGGRGRENGAPVDGEAVNQSAEG